MDHVKYFKDLFQSIPDYRKIVLVMFAIKNDAALLHECGFLKDDNNRLRLEFKNFLMKQNEEYLDYIKNEDESILEKILNKYMEHIFSTMFEVVRHERFLILLLSLTDQNIIKEVKYTDHEIKIKKKFCS